jgi:hypothetical protein
VIVFTDPSGWRTVRFRVDLRVGRIARQCGQYSMLIPP